MGTQVLLCGGFRHTGGRHSHGFVREPAGVPTALQLGQGCWGPAPIRRLQQGQSSRGQSEGQVSRGAATHGTRAGLAADSWPMRVPPTHKPVGGVPGLPQDADARFQSRTSRMRPSAQGCRGHRRGMPLVHRPGTRLNPTRPRQDGPFLHQWTRLDLSCQARGYHGYTRSASMNDNLGAPGVCRVTAEPSREDEAAVEGRELENGGVQGGGTQEGEETEGEDGGDAVVRPGVAVSEGGQAGISLEERMEAAEIMAQESESEGESEKVHEGRSRHHSLSGAEGRDGVKGKGGQEEFHVASSRSTKGAKGPSSNGALSTETGEGEREGQEVHGKGAKLLTWGLVLSLLWRQKLRVAAALVGLVGGTVCNVGIPRISGAFIQSLVIPNGPAEVGAIARALVPLASLYALEPLCTLLYVTNLCSAWEGVVAALRVEVFQRLLTQEISFFDKHKVSELTAVLSTDLGFIEKGVIDNVTRDRGLRSLGEIGSSLVMVFLLCPDLAPVLLSLVICIAISAGLFKKSVVSVFKSALHAQSRLIALASETLSAIRTVRSFGGEQRQLAAFSGAVEKVERLGSRVSFAKSASEAWTRGAVYLSLLGIYTICGVRVRAGLLAPGTLFAFVGYVFILTFAIQGFLNTLTDLQNVAAATGRINALVPSASLSLRDSLLRRGDFTGEEDEDEESSSSSGGRGKQRPEGAGARGSSNSSSNGAAGRGSRGSPVLAQGPCMCYALEAAWHGDLTLEDVRFAYPQRPDVEVLKGISLHLPRGRVTALVGGSGAGKTTVVQLISRFYEPISGRIKLANWSIADFDQKDWTRAVSVVSQEPVLFAMSIRDNIAYGRPEEDHIAEERVVAAAKAANAHDFIMSLPEGYGTKVGERGGLLSGGQRQRIAIARAILKDSPVLVLDEATSALDSISERLVQEALSKLMLGRTTVVIAHRLSTVQEAHQIVVLEEGRIVERGAHSELLQRRGAYADLVNSQHLTFAA